MVVVKDLPLVQSDINILYWFRGIELNGESSLFACLLVFGVFFSFLLPSGSICMCFPEVVYERENSNLGIALGFESVLGLVVLQACVFMPGY